MNEDSGRSDAAPPQQRLLELITQSWTAQAVYVAAELGIADLLRGGSHEAVMIWQRKWVLTQLPSTVFCALTTIDICTQDKGGHFSMTPMGELLGTDEPDSLRHWTIWWGKYLWPVWGQLLYSVKTGKSARTLLTGTEGFKHLESDPQAAAIFNRALAELTRLEAQNVVAAYDFSRFERIVDLGGGYGELLAVILKAFPETQGVLFDLPHAISGAQSHFERSHLADRCEFVAGDFFESIPATGDAYILKSVLHDWNDDRCREILNICRRTMAQNARLLLIERILPQDLDHSAANQSAARSDLTMLVALGAKERSEKQFRDLLSSTGFDTLRIYPAGTVSVVEAIPRG